MKLRFAFSLLMTGLLAGMSAAALGVSPALTTALVVGVMFLASIFRTERLGARADVEAEFWVNYIVKRFWADNGFLKHAFNDDQYVVGGKIVHIPQPGAKPTVVVNRSVYPATAVQRTDTDIMYALDGYTTDPTHIVDADKVQLSYDKIDSVLGDHAGAINETVAKALLIKWLSGIAAGSIVKTTGSAAAAVVAGQTGTRKVLVHQDLQKAALVMNLQNVPTTERYALLEANMYDQLLTSLSNTQYRDFSSYADATNGTVGRLYGFNIMQRSDVAMASSADAINALGAAVAGTDNVVSVCWHKNAVARAMGEVKFFEKRDDPQYYGDVYSALLRMGGRRRFADNKGVVALISAA